MLCNCQYSVEVLQQTASVLRCCGATEAFFTGSF